MTLFFDLRTIHYSHNSLILHSVSILFISFNNYYLNFYTNLFKNLTSKWKILVEKCQKISKYHRLVVKTLFKRALFLPLI
ncbi:hypothetical protein BpHYR1_037517 [Brachionus plicatilis]|uniref:Uncharacterized protein n=1 Tax=Brachionus plicatilis TaxID=10195 RepID=A0A3M7SQK4_BRAPC|nr:hypothetical protein BpHYR1_037517 [Brachionus plicatilis]